eukprot:1618811-Alexandrium_andersonii.AAC.1
MSASLVGSEMCIRDSFAHLAQALCHDVSCRAPTAPQPDSGLPPGVEAAADVWRSRAIENALAEL